MVSHSQNKTQTLYQGPGGQFSLRQLLQPVLMLLRPYYIPTRLAAFLLLQYALLPQGLGTRYFLSLPITYLHPGFHSWFLLELQISSEVSPPQVIQQLLNKMNRSITFYYFSSNDCKLSLSSLVFFQLPCYYAYLAADTASVLLVAVPWDLLQCLAHGMGTVNFCRRDQFHIPDS